MWFVFVAIIIFVAIIYFVLQGISASTPSNHPTYLPPQKPTRYVDEDGDDSLEDVRTMYMADRFDDKFR